MDSPMDEELQKLVAENPEAKKYVDSQGRTWRWRRGKLVQIPNEWVNKHVYRRTYKAREEARRAKRL